MSWALELRTVPEAKLPFREITPQAVMGSENGFDYKVTCLEGSFVQPEKSFNFVFRIKPQDNSLVLSFKER